jgi:hypothetical protein
VGSGSRRGEADTERDQVVAVGIGLIDLVNAVGRVEGSVGFDGVSDVPTGAVGVIVVRGEPVIFGIDVDFYFAPEPIQVNVDIDFWIGMHYSRGIPEGRNGSEG